MKLIGFTEYEAKTYVSLLYLGYASVHEIIEFSEVPSSKIYYVLSKLESKGVVHLISQKPRVYSPEDPAKVLSEIKNKYDHIISELMEKLSAIYKRRHIKSKVLIVKGDSSVIREIKATLYSTEKTVDIIIDRLDIWLKLNLDVIFQELRKNNISIRVITNEKCINEAFQIINIVNDVRVSEEATFLCIIRDQIEVLKGSLEDEPIAVVYNIQKLVKPIKELFNLIWKNSKSIKAKNNPKIINCFMMMNGRLPDLNDETEQR